MEVLLVFAFGARLERPGCEIASFLSNKNYVDSPVLDTRYLQEGGKLGEMISNLLQVRRWLHMEKGRC